MVYLVIYLSSVIITIRHFFSGVPQGSVLGPLLFLIYVNDIAKNMLTMCRLFADDSSLQQSSYNVLDMEQKLNHDLHVLELW